MFYLVEMWPLQNGKCKSFSRKRTSTVSVLLMWSTSWGGKQSNRNRFSQKSSKHADAAVEASYIISESIAIAGKPFTEGEFLKDSMSQVADNLCPDELIKKHLYVSKHCDNQINQNGCQLNFFYNFELKLKVSHHNPWCWMKALIGVTPYNWQSLSEMMMIHLRWQKSCWVYPMSGCIKVIYISAAVWGY